MTLRIPLDMGVEFLIVVDVTGLSEVCENTCVNCGTPDSSISSGTVWKSQISHQERK